MPGHHGYGKQACDDARRAANDARLVDFAHGVIEREGHEVKARLGGKRDDAIGDWCDRSQPCRKRVLERCGGDGEQHHGNARRRKQRGPSRLARECVPGEQAHEAGDEYGAFVGHSFHALHSSKCAKSRGKGGGTAPA